MKKTAVYTGSKGSRSIPAYSSWKDDSGTMMPGNWLKAFEEGNLIFDGQIEVTDVPPKPNPRWYHPDGTEKPVAEVQERLIADVKKRVAAELLATDYLIIRASEDSLRGRPNPRNPDDAALDAREAWRTAGNDIEAAITAATTTAELQAVDLNAWPE